MVEREPPASRHLLPLLRDGSHVASMQLCDWDETVRLARAARLLGTLARRLMADAAFWAQVPAPVQGHLRAARNFAAHRAQLLRMALRALEAALPPGVPVVLLKGAAYLAQDLALAHGRLPGDVDLLVPRGHLDEVEQALCAAGWVSQVADDYDQRYYREWSHELPPMRAPGHALEVDLHHAIAPVTSRCRGDADLLFADAIRLPRTRFAVPCAADQFIHTAIHLFQDTELDVRLRDLVDLDGLLAAVDFSDGGGRFLRRADAHGAGPLVWHALHHCRRWLATAVPAGAWPAAPAAFERRALDWIVPRVCLPRLPDVPPTVAERLARRAAQARYHWMRMPPALLLRHAGHKLRLALPWVRRGTARQGA